MFNSSFYPTPKNIADLMVSKISNKNYGLVLEPSAGKGDLALTLAELKKNLFSAYSKKEHFYGNIHKFHFIHISSLKAGIYLK